MSSTTVQTNIISMFSTDKDNSQISDDALRITEHIASGLKFLQWDAELQLLLSVAMFPKSPMDIHGHWTKEGREALNLIRHLIKYGHPITLPDYLKNPASNEEYSKGIEDRAALLRKDLARLTAPWLMSELLD